ncbi:hypothetical protein M404DRAFT_1001322 [Pisolithus tinctorius Marx 270]|uniref:Uncharacterized protein n=1 Tax=Pisolithus tinctorius Marx 270 TaxID=870435 RepID=A0A0C3P743_PISTI|nr:hypothetical protein M404DRAFT_1001322 [Pisolithus tinctorius Marx 270]
MISTSPKSSHGNCIVTLNTVHCPGLCSPCSEVDYEETPHGFHEGSQLEHAFYGVSLER